MPVAGATSIENAQASCLVTAASGAAVEDLIKVPCAGCR